MTVVELAPSHDLRHGLETLHHALESIDRAPANDGLRRLETSFDETTDLLGWLSATPADAGRVYWRSRDGRYEAAGWGVAQAFDDETTEDPESCLREIAHRLSGAPAGVRYFGGLAFDPASQPASEWGGFGRWRFVVPHVVVERQDGRQRVAVHLGTQADGADLARLLDGVTKGEGTLDYAGERFHEPDPMGWAAGIEAALSTFPSGRLDKVVLARRSRIGLARSLDPLTILGRLRAQQADTVHFAVQPAGGATFLGCSPERLFSRRGGTLRTEAIAGTRPRGATADQDDTLGAELLGDGKERHEHELVVGHVRDAVAQRCEPFEETGRPELLRLRHVQHLCSRFAGTLRDGIGDGDLITALHPTPAVCGLPVEGARQFIRQREPFHRGWYAGPVGWISESGAEFFVAIRSALCLDQTLWTYAGAGIVPGSQPEAEWREIDRKSRPFFMLAEAP